MRAPTALCAALLLAGTACGDSREEDVIDEAEEACFGLAAAGTTLQDAQIAMRGAQVSTNASCRSDLAPLPSNDACAPAEGEARCTVFWYFYTSTVCSPGGGCCQICEARLVQSELEQNGIEAAVCGSRFYRKQPCPL